ncbi:PP2C family protein-serine/threonine phosphatase [Saccharothrix obliqua]|uniref:PP2C family protein-serine/threonine phosphatase n=1 Tax=Saccharothrix obliqua TaxID=2861747 RepID=UPI001C60437D|nr:PP2C family protein-serine/threonine phosphatase [Saccharothrix obliqua]MBW4720554.1 serine/threonine-protein phosphatase [Saccharothrix obliqua]
MAKFDGVVTPVPDGRWDAAPYPVVVADTAGVIRSVNDPARRLFPGADAGRSVAAGVGGWLDAAHRRAVSAGSTSGVSGVVGERTFEAHPVRGDGTVAWWLVDDTDVRRAREALHVERHRAALLGRISSALLTSLNPRRCMSTTAELAAAHLADAAVTIAPGTARGGIPITTCVRDGRAEHTVLEVDPAEVVGLAEALQGFPPVPSRWIDPASAPSWLVPPGMGEVGSIVVTPLPGHGVPAGALVLLRRTGQDAFDEDEEAFARLFAARAGAAMSAARMYTQQAQITELLLRDLLPPVLRRIDGVEFAGRYQPARDTERVGGDFYDVHPPRDGSAESLVVFGDVCGKGLEAAVLTGKVRTTLQALLPLADDHLRVLRMLNDALLRSHHTRFVTLVLASVARVEDGVRLRLTSAGHMPPLIVGLDGEVREADTAGTLVGVLPEINATTAELTLAPGETCLLYTDGITEAHGGPLGREMFGEERLQRALEDCAGMPAEAIAEHVHMLASRWVGSGEHDDIALLAISAPRRFDVTDDRTAG